MPSRVGEMGENLLTTTAVVPIEVVVAPPFATVLAVLAIFAAIWCEPLTS